MATDATVAKGYEQLTAVERFRLAIEAMSRKDWPEVDRLEDTCPRRTYRCEDVEFRDRMRRVHLLALYHCLWVEGPLAKLRLVEAFAEMVSTFAEPVVDLAEVIFRAGRDHGIWEAGAFPQAAAVGQQQPAADGTAAEELVAAVREVREAAVEVAGDFAARVAEGVRWGLGTEVAARREGFGRFCRETLGLEPATLLMALGVSPEGEDDVGPADPAAADRYALWWAERWGLRFPP